MITIYHNPRCSKSREALALVEQFATRHECQVEIIEYLKSPPTVAQLSELHRLLGGPVLEMVRSNEAEYAALDLVNATDADLLNAVAAHPKLLQRPIVILKGRAAIGRPPERLHNLLKGE